MNRIKELEQVIKEAKLQYYNKGYSPLSDKEYDELIEELEQLDPDNSLLKMVGAPVEGRERKLPAYLASLKKIKAEDAEKELPKWIRNYPGPYIISQKLDGDSSVAQYRFTSMKAAPTIQLSSRGDGKEGMDIDHLVQYLQLPKLPYRKGGYLMRGELICTRDDFSAGLIPGKNVRNAVSGLMKDLKPDPAVAKLIHFVVYDLIEPRMGKKEALEQLTQWGFEVAPYSVVDSISGEQLESLLHDQYENSPYDIDGLVVEDDSEVHNIVSDENPKYAFAYKSNAVFDIREVTVLGVEWNESKDRYLAPRVLYEPTALGGTIMQAATAYNGKFVLTMGIGTGARITVIRSGNVIPKVISVVTPAKPTLPTVAWHWSKNETFMIADERSIDGLIAELVFFCKKLELDFLAIGTVTKLVHAGIDTIIKLTLLKRNQLNGIDGIGSILADKLMLSIGNIKQRGLVPLVAASNLMGRGVGVRRLEPVFEVFPDLLTNPRSVDELRSIKGIGPELAQSIHFGIPAVVSFLNAIDYPYKEEKKQEPAPVENGRLGGKRIVFSGFRDDKDKTLTKAIEQEGGKVEEGVNKNTSLVVTKENGEETNKTKKADQYGITVLSRAQFEQQYLS